MKRDMDLVRSILLQIEEKDVGDERWIEIENSNTTTIAHLFLMQKAGLIEGNDLSSMTGRDYKPRRLTWAGHDFLDAVRDPDTWKRTKDGALAVGGVTFDLLKDLAKGFAKKKLEDVTGVKL